MRIFGRKMIEDTRVNSWQGGQENCEYFFFKDMKTPHPFHGQILAVSEIMVKRKLRKLKTETLWMSSENGREEILPKDCLKEWQRKTM